MNSQNGRVFDSRADPRRSEDETLYFGSIFTLEMNILDVGQCPACDQLRIGLGELRAFLFPFGHAMKEQFFRVLRSSEQCDEPVAPFCVVVHFEPSDAEVTLHDASKIAAVDFD